MEELDEITKLISLVDYYTRNAAGAKPIEVGAKIRAIHQRIEALTEKLYMPRLDPAESTDNRGPRVSMSTGRDH